MRSATFLRITILVIGLLLIAGAFVTAFVIEPDYVARLPDDFNAERTYAGTFKVLLDPQAVAQGNLAAALKQNVPLAVDRRVKVLATSGDSALVSDARTTTSAGAKVEQTTWQYALDRKSLEPVTHHPSSWSVVNATGLTVSWPIGAKQQSYTGWVPETATTTPVDYVRTEQRGGLKTYVYQATVAPTRITDSQVLAGLPQALPQSLLKLLLQFGPLTPAVRAQLTALLPTLGDPVPLSYTLQENDTFWVEPETGVVIDVSRRQVRTAGVTGPNGAFVAVLPVVDASYQATPSGVSAAVNDANDGRDAIEWVGTIIPVIAGVIGALLVTGALLTPRLRRWWRGRRRAGRESASGSESR